MLELERCGTLAKAVHSGDIQEYHSERDEARPPPGLHSAGAGAGRGTLILFSVILLPASLLAFRYAVRKAKMEGTLVHY
jgi:hypothetical protein